MADITGTNNRNIIVVFDDDMTIDALGGNDWILNFGDGSTIDAGSGKDTVINFGDDVDIDLGSGNDFVMSLGDGVAIEGGAGKDFIISYGDDGTIDGGAGNDTLEVYGDNNIVSGGMGNDSILVEGSFNTIFGDEGKDKITVVGHDNDVMGGSGRDKIFIFGDNNIIHADSGNDLVKLYGDFNQAFGGDGNDTLRILLGQGNALYGEAGDDKLYGGNLSDDILEGGSGFDLIQGKGGTDTVIFTGNRSDYFVEEIDANTLRITDLVSGRDDVDLVIKVELYQFADGTLTKAELLNPTSNNDPIAVDDVAVTDEDTAVTINVLGNDSDPDGDLLQILNVNAANGSIQIQGGSLIYTPNADFNGTDIIDYTISDGNGGTASAQVTVTVNAVNDAPVVANAIADQAIDEDNAFNFVVPANAFADVDGDLLTLTATLADDSALPAWLSFDGSAFSGTPPLNFNGELDIKVTASDGSLTASDVFKLTINPINDAPVAVDDTAITLDEDTVASNINVLGNDSDVDGDTLTVVSASALNGSVVINGDGTLNYTPDANFNGSDTITYTISDGSLTDSATIAVTVNAVDEVIMVSVPIPTLEDLNGLVLNVEEFNNNGTTADYRIFLSTDPLTPIIVANLVIEDGPHELTFKNGLDTQILTIIPDGVPLVAGLVELSSDANLVYSFDADRLVLDGNASASNDIVHIRSVGAGPTDSEVYGDGFSISNAIAGDDEMNGGDGNDVIYGDAHVDSANSVGGNDTINGGMGDDRLHGDSLNSLQFTAGNDVIDGGDGDDQIYGDSVGGGLITGGDDTLTGGSGADTFHYWSHSTITNGNDVITDFEAGVDKLHILGATLDSVAALDAQIADVAEQNNNGTTADYLITLAGGAGTILLENLTIADGPHEIIFTDGLDTQILTIVPDGVTPTSGSDLVLDATPEVIYNFDDTLSLIAGQNDDIVYKKGDAFNHIGDARDLANAVGGNDVINGGAGNDRLYGDGVTMFNNATGGDDIINGGDGVDTIYGDASSISSSVGGDDIINGGAGNDFLYGDSFSMSIGVGGDDTIKGGAGDDFLRGDSNFIDPSSVGGADTFVYDTHINNGSDVIGDFESQDTLRFENVLDDGLSESNVVLLRSSGNNFELINNVGSNPGTFGFINMGSTDLLNGAFSGTLLDVQANGYNIELV